jgi:HTH-type transcriptional regulator, transcriptional repressor of NAD biosynthesis genes
MKRGLVLGKFAPLHRGHQVLIETSIEQCDQTVVLIYDAREVTNIPLSVRAGWVRRLYPSTLVLEGHGSPTATGTNLAVMRIQEHYIKEVVPAPITHFFSSEWYGEHVSKALDAIDVRVDMSRTRVPVSGTALREAPYRYRRFVEPLVYQDLVVRVVLLGAESTGKSTLAQRLAREFGSVSVPEYGREYWNMNHDQNGTLSKEQLVELAQTHRQREDEAILEANRLLFVDTDARTTRQYSRWYYRGAVHSDLDRMASECAQRYRLVVLCDDDIHYVEDGSRAGQERRKVAQGEIRQELEASGVAWLEVTGSIERRVAAVREHVSATKLSEWR